MDWASVALEIFLAVLLVAAAVSAWRLDRRLSALRSGQDGVAASVRALVDATQRAEASIAALRGEGRQVGEALRAEITAARALADELRLLGGGIPEPAPRPAARPAPKPAPRTPTPEANSQERLRALLGTVR